MTFKKLYANVIDALYPLEEITKEMAKVKKIDQVPANLNPYKLAHLLAGWKGKADAWLEYKPYSFKTYKFSETIKSFKEITEPVKNERHKFDTYLVHKRALNIPEEESGILRVDAVKIVSDLEKEYPKFKQAAIGFKHYQNGLLRYLYDGGIINGEQFLKMRQANEDYTPWHRVMDYERKGGAGSGPGHEVKGAPIYKRTGSWRPFISPTESIIKNTYAFINAAEKNAVGRSLVALSKTSEGLGKFIEKIPADTQRIAVKDTELEEMLRKYGKWTETTQFQTTERTIRESIKDETGADIPAGDRGTRIMKERAVEALKTRGYSEAEANTIVAGSPARRTRRPGAESSSASRSALPSGTPSGNLGSISPRGWRTSTGNPRTPPVETSSPSWSGASRPITKSTSESITPSMLSTRKARTPSSGSCRSRRGCFG